MIQKPLFSSLSSWSNNIFTDEDKKIQCDVADYVPTCPYCQRRTNTDEQGWYCCCGAYGDRTGTYNPLGHL